MPLHWLYQKLYTFAKLLQILAAAILDHHYLSAQNKMQCFHCIPHMRKPRHRHQKYASTLITVFDLISGLSAYVILGPKKSP